MERIAVGMVRVAVRFLAITLTAAIAFPHVAGLLIIAAVTAVGSGWESGVGLLLGSISVVSVWGFAHKRSFLFVAHFLGKWRTVVFGIWRWHRTVKGLQLDSQDGEKVRAPRVRKVRGS